jgi:hypothetical protein
MKWETTDGYRLSFAAQFVKASVHWKVDKEVGRDMN